MGEAVVAVTPHGPWTMDDVMRLPDDGQRYEILDGSLLVSPPPGSPHQRAAHRLAAMLNRDAGRTGRPSRPEESCSAAGPTFGS